VLAEVASDGPMGSLRLNGLAVRSDQHGGHQAKGAKALGNRVGLHITVVVLARPDKASLRLEAVRNHVVDEAVLIPDPSRLELLLVSPASEKERERE